MFWILFIPNMSIINLFQRLCEIISQNCNVAHLPVMANFSLAIIVEMPIWLLCNLIPDSHNVLAKDIYHNYIVQ